MPELRLLTELSTVEPAGAKERKPRKRELKNLMKRDGVWYFHKLVNGKREFGGRKTPFSLETQDLAVAKAKRDAILRAADGKEVDRVLGRSSVKTASIGAVLEAYETADHPRQVTRKKYMRDLRLLLRKAWGEDRDLMKTPVTDLNALVVHNYQDAVVAVARREALAAGVDPKLVDNSDVMQLAKFNANRTLTQARSIFANEKPFRKLHVPRPTGFLEADLFHVQRDLSYTPMAAGELALFVAESAKLKAAAHAGDERAIGTYLVWLCMRWLGMRNSEVEHCKPAEWLVDTPQGWVMSITNRPYFLVKGVGSVRDLPLADWLREELQALSKGREWLVPGPHVTARHEFTHYAINDWMSDCYDAAVADRQLPANTETRTAYDWRKQAGSELYEKTKDILAVSKWLGHASVTVTTKWYVNLIRRLPSLA